MPKLSELVEAYVDTRIALHEEGKYRFPNQHYVRALVEKLEKAKEALDNWRPRD